MKKRGKEKKTILLEHLIVDLYDSQDLSKQCVFQHELSRVRITRWHHLDSSKGGLGMERYIGCAWIGTRFCDDIRIHGGLNKSLYFRTLILILCIIVS